MTSPLDRRDFVATTTLAALGLAAGCAPVAGSGGSALTAETTSAPAAVTATPTPDLPAGWSPLTDLSTVSVAADPAARDYPALGRGKAFDEHPAVALVTRALAGASAAGSAVAFLRTLVREGGSILLKPNWVEPADWDSAKITHPALVLAVARLAAEAVGPTGKVVIGEGTSEGPDLARIMTATGFARALGRSGDGAATATRAPITIADLNSAAVGRLTADLGSLSRFASSGDVRFFDGHGRDMGRMGEGRVGRYLLARPVVDADLVIDFAKVKVHVSAGVTLALKNLVGIVPSADGPYGDDSLKDIPHFSAEDVSAGRKFVGNRTIGMSMADMHAMAAYVARDGSVQRAAQRKVLCIVDGVVSGQRSQFKPDPVATGWIAVGTDPVAVDHVATRCMGFDPALVTSLKPSAEGELALGTADPARVRIVYDGPGAFAAYFTESRRLVPERVTADWGDRIALRAFTAARPEVRREGATVAAVGAGAARLEGAAGYLSGRASNGAWTFALPQGIEGLRLVFTDAHFNVVEEGVT